MMSEDDLYKQAIKDVKDLAADVLDECKEFADKYAYEKDWVYDRFLEEFSKLKRSQ